jgi:hypothetical protein
MVDPRLVSVIRPVVSTFERLEIPYYLGGSVAAIIYGLPRSTLDADLSASFVLAHVPKLVAAWEEDFYVSGPMIREAIQRHSCFNLIHLKSAFKFNIFCAHAQAFQQSVLARRRRDSLVSGEDELSIDVASLEDLVLHKLVWLRKGNETSERQWLDILTVLKLQADSIDAAYIAEWAATLDVLDLWERIRDEAAVAVQ